MDYPQMPSLEEFSTSPALTPDTQDIPPLTEAEIDFVKALAALNISAKPIKTSIIRNRTPSSGQSLKIRVRRKLEAEIDAVIDELKTGPSQAETSRTLAEHLATNIADFHIEQGVQWDLANGERATLRQLIREKRAFEEWKRSKGAQSREADEDSVLVAVPPPKLGLDRAYDMEMNHIKPRLRKVEYMVKTIESWWRDAGVVAGDVAAKDLEHQDGEIVSHLSHL